MSITIAQQKFLKDRLYSVNKAKPGRYDRLTKQQEEAPARIKAARQAIEKAKALISEFESGLSKKAKATEEAQTRAYNVCMQVIMFGKPEEAIAAIDKFEATKFF
jgi:predicted ABC-type ATPase